MFSLTSSPIFSSQFQNYFWQYDNQGLRFMPARPTVTVYDEAGAVVKRFAADTFPRAFWCDLQFSSDGETLYVLPNSAAKEHAERRYPHKPVKVVDSGIRGR